MWKCCFLCIPKLEKRVNAMTRLLLVDDEIHAVHGIKSAVNWGELGISEVLAAYNITQAKACFETGGPIDIMLCDIEMPQGNGLELLAWVREKFPDTVSIFLTCHADFQYAKQAIQLGSFDYLLKPVPIPELEAIIVKALNKKAEEKEKSKYSQYGQFWLQHQPFMIERFWLDLLSRSIPSNQASIKQVAEERNILFAEQMKFIPVLIAVKHWHKSLNVRDEKILEYALRNTAEELLLGERGYGQLLPFGNGNLMAILSAEEWSDQQLEGLKRQCDSLVRSCKKYFYCDVSCYVGYPEHSHELPDMADRLQAMDHNNVVCDSIVLLQGGIITPTEDLHTPELSVWSLMLQEGSPDKLIAEVTEYLERLAKSSGINANLLHQFHQDFLQMVYSFLYGKGIQAHRLFGDEQSAEMAQHATRSVKDAIEWCRHIILKAKEYVQVTERSESVIDRIASYILQNLNNALSRDDIARQVYLNPDYLDRIFKKKLGLSVTEYVAEQRISIAKQLLCNTKLSVSAIAIQVGIDNFSYFSRIFKKYTGQNPLEYRQACSEGY